MEEKVLKVKGMTCEHCVKAVTNALESIKGVSDIFVSLKEGTASFKYEPSVPLQTIKTAITDEGFEVE